MSCLASVTNGAAATRACRQIDMMNPASAFVKECVDRGKSFDVDEVVDCRGLGGEKRPERAIQRLSNTRLGATLVRRSMQYQILYESIRPS